MVFTRARLAPWRHPLLRAALNDDLEAVRSCLDANKQARTELTRVAGLRKRSQFLSCHSTPPPISHGFPPIRHPILLVPQAVHAQAEGGVTALHLAAGFASAGVLTALLEAGADVDAALAADLTDPTTVLSMLSGANDDTLAAYRCGTTALHIAVFLADHQRVAALLAGGANPNASGVCAMCSCCSDGLWAAHTCKIVCPECR